MKIKRRYVTDVIADLHVDERIPAEIRDRAKMQSKVIAKLMNTRGAIKNSPEVHDIIGSMIPAQKSGVPAKKNDVRAATRLIGEITTRLAPGRKVKIKAGKALKALSVDNEPGKETPAESNEQTPAEPGEQSDADVEKLRDYLEKHFDLQEQYLECNFVHGGRRYSLEVTDDSDDYLRFHIYSGAPDSRGMSKHYDVGRHIDELNYTYTIVGRKLKAGFRDKNSKEQLFSITLNPNAQKDSAATANLAISDKLLKDTKKGFEGENVECSIKFVD